MIFHTAADLHYYRYFYNFYKTSIKKFYPDAKLSLRYMGNDPEKITDVDYLVSENIDIHTIYKNYSPENDKDALGYYAISRWLSLPIDDDHIVVSDTDIMAVKTLPHDVNELLKRHQVINITRTKKDYTEGGMAMIIIHKDIASIVSNYAKELLETQKLHWELDVFVKKFLYNNFDKIELPEMHVLNKHSQINVLDHTTRSFVIRKGRINEKINTLRQVSDLITIK